MCMVISTNGSWNGYSMGSRAERYEPQATLPSRYLKYRRSAKMRPPRRQEMMKAMAYQRGKKVLCHRHANTDMKAAGKPFDPKKCAFCQRALTRIIEVRDWMVEQGEVLVESPNV